MPPKKRIYERVKGNSHIEKILVWDDVKQAYLPPIRGKKFRVRKTIEGKFGIGVRVAKCFATLQEARRWLTGHEVEDEPAGPTLSDVIDEWRRYRAPRLEITTVDQYEKVIKLYLAYFIDWPVSKITARSIDEWILWMREFVGKFPQAKARSSFRIELKVLSLLLRFYMEHFEDYAYPMPVRRRHREERVVSDALFKPKDITPEELYSMTAQLRKGKYGTTLAAMAIFQYYQSRRISEAAGIYWEDVRLDLKNPHNSTVTFRRYVQYRHRGKKESTIKGGAKNVRRDSDIQVMPLYPESFFALLGLYRQSPTKKGLVFVNPKGTFFTYASVQNAYNRAFSKAGLPYTATHVMRHGGTRWVLNSTGDEGLAQQQLGNADRKSVETYAKRWPKALIQYAEKIWEQKETGINWYQIKIEAENSK